jgi:hypothetical protein
MKAKWKSTTIAAYESFYRTASDKFRGGSIGGGGVDALNAMMI